MTKVRATAPVPATEPVAQTRVAYHAGPPSIIFLGRAWLRDQVQSVPTEEWIRMNQRSDFPEFDFREES